MNGIGVYPGSFNPWHEGHEDVLNKALKVFDKVIILIGYNPDKGEDARDMHRMSDLGPARTRIWRSNPGSTLHRPTGR